MTWTHHARVRAHQMGLPELVVEAVVSNPEVSYTDDQGARIYQRGPLAVPVRQGRLLTVLLRQTDRWAR